jgi:hypothetical protein
VCRLPHVEDYIWARSEGLRYNTSTERVAGRPLGSLPWRYSQYEPAINRYKTGGDFPIHVDGHALTLNILLNKPGAESFSGGGTAFWCEPPPHEQDGEFVRSRSQAFQRSEWVASGSPQATLAIHPKDAGTAVLFSGTVQHAGLPVSAGVRYLLVASFSIADGEYEPTVYAPPHWAAATAAE